MFGVKFIKFDPTEYVLKYKNGKIVEEGTHEELIAKSGEYNKLYKMQFATHEEEEQE